MSIENKVIDLTIDENVPFSLIIQFLDVDDSVYPPSEVPVNLTNYSLKGCVKSSLEDNAELLATFSTTIVDAAQGAASISLPVEATTVLSTKADKTRDKYNPRLRLAGYYDVIITRTVGSSVSSFRIMEGKVFISDGVTK